MKKSNLIPFFVLTFALGFSGCTSKQTSSITFFNYMFIKGYNGDNLAVSDSVITYFETLWLNRPPGTPSARIVQYIQFSDTIMARNNFFHIFENPRYFSRNKFILTVANIIDNMGPTIIAEGQLLDKVFLRYRVDGKSKVAIFELVGGKLAVNYLEWKVFIKDFPQYRDNKVWKIPLHEQAIFY